MLAHVSDIRYRFSIDNDAVLITGGTEALLVGQIVREGTNGQQADERNSRTAMWPL